MAEQRKGVTTTSEAGRMGGERVRELVEKGKRTESGRTDDEFREDLPSSQSGRHQDSTRSRSEGRS
jgi:hypothetical protein